jgi:spermidine/putrescine transport system permease protein
VSAVSHIPVGDQPEVVEQQRRRGLTGYLLLLPGGLWLALFFLVPLVTLVASSLYDPAGSLIDGYSMTGHVGNYSEAISEYAPTFVRSFVYALIATLACVVLGYPLAYAIAFKAGRWKNLMLVAVIAPFFTSFLVRTLSWKLLLGDQGFVADTARALHLIGPDGYILE